MFKITPIIEKALRIAYTRHHGQVDKGGNPYIFHPYNVAARCYQLFSLNPELKLDYDLLIAAALLHDTLEDTDYTVNEVEEAFPELKSLAHTLVSLSKLPEEDREHYLTQIIGDSEPYALIVKICDIEENKRLDRKCPDAERQAARNRLYEQELIALKDALRRRFSMYSSLIL